MSHSARRLTATLAATGKRWRPDTADVLAPVPATAIPAVQTISRHRASLPVHEPALPQTVADRIAAAEREAYSRGTTETERAAAAAAAARVAETLERLGASIEEVAALRLAVLQRSERDLVQLAMAMAERIVRRSIEVDRTILLTMARAAIERLGTTTAATIHLNPIDYDAIRLARPEALSGGGVEVLADPQVARGGCLVKSVAGVIDAGIDTQLRELSRALLGDRQPAPPPADDAAIVD